MGRLHWLEAIPLVGSHPFGWPKAHGPLLGGGNTLSRGVALGVVYISPPVPLGRSSPDGPHIWGSRRNLLEVTIPILPISTSHIVDSFLPIDCYR